MVQKSVHLEMKIFPFSSDSHICECEELSKRSYEEALTCKEIVRTSHHLVGKIGEFTTRCFSAPNVKLLLESATTTNIG